MTTIPRRQGRFILTNSLMFSLIVASSGCSSGQSGEAGGHGVRQTVASGQDSDRFRRQKVAPQLAAGDDSMKPFQTKCTSCAIKFTNLNLQAAQI
jgi:hypothetical protein